MFHSNRVVIHPDYAGMGLGVKFVTATARLMKRKISCEVYATFSSIPMAQSRLRDTANWKLLKTENRIGVYKNVVRTKGGRGSNGVGSGGFRCNVKLFIFKYIGGA